MRQLLPMALLLVACVPNAADEPQVGPRAQMGSYVFDDGIRVSGGRFDESGSQMLLYMDTATSSRGSTLKPDGDGFVPAFNFGDVERVTFSDGNNRMQWQMPSGEVGEARRVMRPEFRDVQFKNGDVTLRGTLYLPPDAGTQVPAVVLAHGSGPATRHLGTWTTFFLEQGLAVLSYDKRGVGESTGDWRASSYFDLAADLSRAVDHIRQLPMIDSDRVGIHTSSQSGWYGPHVARNNPGVAFLIQRVGPAVNIGIGVAHEIREEWRAEGLPEKDIQAGIEFWLELHRLAAEDAALAQANTLFDDAKKEPWFAQTFGEWEPIEPAWWQRKVANMQLEPGDDVVHLDIPVLWFLAENDQNVPYTESHAALQKAQEANTQLELITIEDSPHSFLLPAADDKVRYTRNYWPVMSAWLRDRGFVDAPPQIFRFTTDRFWLNLHHFLYVLGRAQAGMPNIDRRAVAQAPRDEKQGLAELSLEEQALWREAVAIYAEGPSQLDMVFDEKLLKTTHVVKDAVGLEEVEIDPKWKAALEKAEPLYRRVWWPEHQAANEAWVEATESLLEEHGEAVLVFLLRAYGQTWPEDGYPVQLSGYANWAGAYSTYGHLLVISSLDDALLGSLAGLEILFHEAAHQFDSAIFDELVAAARAEGTHFDRGLDHALLFFTVGEAVRSAVSEHVPYAHAYGVWNRGMKPFLPALETGWQPYLASEELGDEAARRAALQAVMRALRETSEPASPPSGGP